MKILIVNTSDVMGGAARAAYRLHQSLLAKGVDSKMLVQSKNVDDFTVLGPSSLLRKVSAKVSPTLDSLPTKLYPNKEGTLFSSNWLFSSRLVDQINSFNPDIVHLHWISNGMLRLEDLSKIKAPLVWSMHDNWLYTGGCHISWSCKKYTVECNQCPVLKSQKNKDLSFRTFQRKKKVFSKLSKLHIVGLSRWITNCAKDSALLKDRPITNLPNPLDVSKYNFLDKSVARKILGLPDQIKLVAFGAVSATSDVNKGFQQLSSALQFITQPKTELIVFGATKPEIPNSELRFPIHYAGYLHDDISLRVLYCAADVLVVPSLQENLSNAVMEALACGTPVVAFDVGGNSDLIDHKSNGYLAAPYDIDDLANGINWILGGDQTQSQSLSIHARAKVEEKFDSKLVADSYISLYKSILEVQV